MVNRVPPSALQTWKCACLLALLLAEEVLLLGAPKIQPFSFPSRLKVLGRTSVICTAADGTQPFTFSWLKDGSSVAAVKNVREEKKSDYSVLIIEPVEAVNAGNYTCIVKNKAGFDSHTAYLEVEAPPAWKGVPGNTDIVQGKELVLSCKAHGSPTPKVTWLFKKGEAKDWVPVQNTDAHMTVRPDGSLGLTTAQESHNGDFRCSADNGIGKPISHTIAVKVRVPARFEEKSAAVTTRRTEVTRMKCQATGDQPLSIAWSKGSVKLDKRTSARYEVFETLIPDGLLSELVIRDTDRSDGALYTCHTQNKYGKDDRKVKLIVQEVPGPPQDVRLKDVWSRSASVSWSPSYSGNSPISKYIVQYWRDHGTAHRLQELEVIGSTTWTMVRDLLPGTAYVLNLVAENVIGRGEPSRTVVFHTGEEEPEAPPVDILVEMKGPSTVYISWKAPPREHWNGHLLGYYIGYRPRDSESPFSYRRVEASPNNASHEYLLGGLQRGTEYGLVLRAYNSAGSGPASQEKTVRTMDGDVPEAPRLFVTAVTADSMTLRWVIRSSSDVTGFNIHYRQDGGTWLELPIVNTANNTYTLTNLHPGYVYQVYVTASNVLGRGDPSAILLIRTESTASGHESSAIENKLADDTVPIYMDMAVMIPAGAILLAVLVILFSTCICVRKMKSTPRPVPEIMRYDPATLNTGTMMSQRYVEMEKMSEQDVPFAAPYEGGTIRNGTEMRGTLKERQEMKTYVPKPQNPMKDRPLPHPEQSPLRVDETYYDSAQ
ncbi:cell adhesion molecule Dscam1-like isoform X4 [Amblyomma americanum]